MNLKKIALSLSALVFVGAVAVAGTNAFFSSSATSTGNVFTAGTLDLKIAQNSISNTPTGGWLDTQTVSWNFTDMAPGGTPDTDAVWLKNVGSVDGMTLGVAMDNASATVSGTPAQMRITSMTFDGSNLLEGGAGHNFGLYEAPVSCHVEVNFGNNDFTRISSAVDAAIPGQTICVGPGNYSTAWEAGGSGFPIVIDTNDVTVVSVGGPDMTTVGGGMVVSNPGVTLSGFRIAGESTYLGQTFGVYVSAAAVNSEVSFNEVVGLNTPASRGVLTETGASSVVIEHNDSQNWATGIYVNPSSGMTVQYNTLTDNNVGMSNDNPSGNTVQYNHIENNAFEGVGIALASGNTLTFERNNIIGNGVDVGQYGTETVVAQNNWWGSFTPASQITGNVDTTNFAGGPFVGYVNGNDFNGNGYADLQDLNNDPILSVMPGLDAGEEKQFVMAVQLDGPTTGNSFQGASLTTDIVFTLNQVAL